MNEKGDDCNASASEADLLSALAAVVGKQFVLNSDEMRAKHSADTIPYRKICAAVVYPSTVSEVRKILQVAADFHAQVWPFSRGNNWGYGAKSALEDDAIIMILERMNRIIEVNEELAYAVIEPGVSQQQLSDYLRENNIKLWMDCTDSTPNGSVLGNAVERGYGYTSYGDHFDCICGLEVVLPDGSVVKTGGEHAEAKTWNTFKWGAGPYFEGLFSQSNLGIVVKGGIWLMPEPECFNVFSFEIDSDANLAPVIDSLRDLSLEGAIQCHTHMVNDFQMMTLLRQYPYELLDGASYLSEQARSNLRAQYQIPLWSLIGGLYGSKEVVQANRARIKKVLLRYGSLEFFDEKKIDFAKKFIQFAQSAKKGSIAAIVSNLFKPLISVKPLEVMRLLPEISGILKGIPNESILTSAYIKSKNPPPSSNLNPAEDGCGIMWLAPALPASGVEAQKLLEITKPLYKKHGFDFSACFTLMNSRTFFFLLGIFFDQENIDEKTRAFALFNDLADTTKAAGYKPYRLGINSMDKFLEEVPELGTFFARIKSVVDPTNVLAPGKYVNRNS